MAWCVEHGILEGKNGNRLDPKGNATRAEAAAIFQRFLELEQRDDPEEPDETDEPEEEEQTEE